MINLRTYLQVLKVLLVSIAFILLLSGCSGNNSAEMTQITQAAPIDIDYSLFVKKVKDQQIESAVIYPADQIILVSFPEDEQKYRLDYSSNEEASNGYQIRTLLIENEIPFRIEDP